MYPIEIIGLGRDTLSIHWDDDHLSTWPARALRLMCKCAECVEEMSGRKLLDATKVPWPLHCETIQMVGNYGLRIHFSDGHDLGIYQLRDLRLACPCPQCR